MDAVITTGRARADVARVGYLESALVTPVVGNEAFGTGGAELCVALELYAVDGGKTLLLQQR
jgi:hypothetical protein